MYKCTSIVGTGYLLQVWIVHGKRPRSWLLSCATARPACKLQPTGTFKPSSCNNLTCNLQPAPPAPASASERERECGRVRECAPTCNRDPSGKHKSYRALRAPCMPTRAPILLSSCLLASCPVALSPHTKLSQSTLLIRPPAAAAGAGAQPSPAQTRVHTFL